VNKDEILNLINKISPHGMEYVDYAFKNGNVEILSSLSTGDNKGILLKVDTEASCIFYASFLKEEPEAVFDVIHQHIEETLLNAGSKEICFNVFGKNTEIIPFIRQFGFELDMEGYHMEYVNVEDFRIKESNLVKKGYEGWMLDQFVTLFEQAYYQLIKDNGWAINGYAVNKMAFHKSLVQSYEKNEVASFWFKDELIGAYLLEGNYITDLVVNPLYQNKGYGTTLLAHCIHDLKKNPSINKIRLRVARSNEGAIRFYQRSGFVEIAHFAEHTYKERQEQ
jgi:ribosomal protein S18 acetylase RimI-like enzyme